MNSQRKNDYSVFVIAFLAFLLMMPKLCAQSASTVEVSKSDASFMAEKVVTYSKGFLGKPYRSGGVGPDSFDCSGYVFTMFRESVGIQLPRQASAMYQKSKKIEDSEIRQGDLLFFKTTSSGNISHVGIYIDGGKFIHSASDGPETGVIISTIKSGYWKTHYTCAGRIINSTDDSKNKKNTASADEPKNSANSSNSANSTKKEELTKVNSEGEEICTEEEYNPDSKVAVAKKKENTFLKSLVFDGSLAVNWNLFDADSFRLCFRGIDTMVHAMYDGDMKPGLGMYIRYDNGIGALQIPIVLSYTLSEYVRLFIGPVITIGKPTLPGDSGYKLKASAFPGILGIAFSTPSIEAGKFKFSFVQDIHYTVFNDSDKSALTPYKSFISGLVLSTGIRVTLPMSNLIK